jgi:hypothetical protein
MNACDIYVMSHNDELWPEYTIPVAKEFLDTGGAMILFKQESDQMTAFMRALGYSQITNQGGGSYLHQFNPNLPSNDPIRYGPFSPYATTSSTLMYWGEDWGNPGRLGGVNSYPNDMVVYTGANDPAIFNAADNRATALRLTNKSLVWFGDGGFIGHDVNTWNNYGVSPFMIQDNYLPVVRPNYRNDIGVYNSMLVANSVAWAITQTGNRTTTP